MIIDIQDFSCRYETRKDPTLSHISFSAAEGEMVLIAGLSGCGKSTLIKAVTGLLDGVETEGRIYLNGQDVGSLSAEDIGLTAGTVYQTPDDQLFAMTIEDEVGFALENRGESKEKIKSEVGYALEKVGLGGMEKKSIHALSGGQRQRLVLASILVTHPKLLILDEPVSQMNPKGVQDFIRLLLELNRKDHMTILMVEHRVNELARWFPRLCVMHEGRFIYDGPVEEAWNRIEDTESYGLREPQTVKLCRKLGLKPATSDPVKLNAMIKMARLPLIAHVQENILRPSAPVILEGRNIHYTYPGSDRETLHGLDLTIHQGTINVLMGFNGAGKSTLLDILAGLEHPTSGQILFRGRPAEQERSHVGLMRQEADLMLLADTVEEELTWNNRNLSEDELEGLLERLHVSQYRKDFPLALSKGQRLRVVLGAMLARKDNELLLLDEPTTGQDQKSLHEIKEMLLYASSVGRTIFICTHDIELASELADEVFVMKEGNFIAQGRPHDIFSNRELMEKSGLALPPMIEVSEKIGIEPCITIEEVMNHVLQTDLGGRQR